MKAVGYAREFWRQFTSRQSSVFVQFVKYSLCGCVAVAVHVVTFYFFAWLVLPAIKEDDIVVRILGIPVTGVSEETRMWNAGINNWIAFFFSNLAAYVLNVLWVFESGRHSRWVEVGMFYAVSAFSILIGTLVMMLLIKFIGSSTTAAFAADIAAAALVNFAMRKYVIFKG